MKIIHSVTIRCYIYYSNAYYRENTYVLKKLAPRYFLNQRVYGDLPGIKKEISRYLGFMEGLPIDGKLKEKGKERLSRFLNNLDLLNRENPGFAISAANHKLYVLKDFEKYYRQSTNLSGYFKEAFYGSYNIGIVDRTGVFRNSQPCQKDFAWLAKESGVKTVINLRREDSYWEGFGKKEEEKICRELGLNYINFKLDDNDNPSPSKEDIEQVLRYIDTCPKPVMFHCAKGKGRAGMVGAAYRISRQNWKFEDAIKEAIYYDFDPKTNPNQVNVIRQFVS